MKKIIIFNSAALALIILLLFNSQQKKGDNYQFKSRPESNYEFKDTISLPMDKRADSLHTIFQVLQENKDPGLKLKFDKKKIVP